MARSREKEERLRVKTVMLRKTRGWASAITGKASVAGKLEDIAAGTVRSTVNSSPAVVAAAAAAAAARNRQTEKSLLEPTSKTRIHGLGEVYNLDSGFGLVARPAVPKRQVASKGVR